MRCQVRVRQFLAGEVLLMDLNSLLSWLQPFVDSFVQWLQQFVTALLGALGA
jgi:hypothetical protein